MEIPETGYLYNLSVLAITFSTITALVMLLRQTMGGKMSNFDLVLITNFLSAGFVVAVDAILPPLLLSLGLSTTIAWMVASGAAAVVTAWAFVRAYVRRRAVTKPPMPLGVAISFLCYSLSVLLMAVNAILPQLRNGGMFLAALSLLLGSMMWAFARRVASLLGETPSVDFDPNKG
jgi:hypothetical protein